MTDRPVSQAERLAALQSRRGSSQHSTRNARIATAGATATGVLGLLAIYGTADVAATSSVEIAAVDTTLVAVDTTLDTTPPPTAAPIKVTVVVDADGQVVSAPADLDPELVQAAVTDYQREVEAIRASATTTPTTAAPVNEPNTVDLAIPAAPRPKPKAQTRKSSGSSSSSSSQSSSSGGSNSGGSSSGGSSKPKAKSSGS